jgi:hypothetical protein
MVPGTDNQDVKVLRGLVTLLYLSLRSTAIGLRMFGIEYVKLLAARQPQRDEPTRAVPVRRAGCCHRIGSGPPGARQRSPVTPYPCQRAWANVS